MALSVDARRWYWVDMRFSYDVYSNEIRFSYIYHGPASVVESQSIFGDHL